MYSPAEAEAEFRRLAERYRIHSGSFVQVALMCLGACYGNTAIGMLHIGFWGGTGNFVFHSILALLLAVSVIALPNWWPLLRSRFLPPDNGRRLGKIPEEAAEDRERMAEFLRNGWTPPPPRWVWCRMLLLIVLFENYVGNVWMQGGGAERFLAWQPEWLLDAADWVRQRTDSRSWFAGLNFKFSLDDGSPAAQYFVDDAAFLHSDLGTGMLFLQFTRLFTFPLALLAVSRIARLGFGSHFGRCDPANIRNTGSLAVCLLLSLIALPLAFPLPLLPLISELALNAVADPAWLPESRLGFLTLRLPLLYYWMELFVGLLGVLYLKGWLILLLRRLLGRRQPETAADDAPFEDFADRAD